jgi:hypothetical protein
MAVPITSYRAIKSKYLANITNQRVPMKKLNTFLRGKRKES